MAHSLGCNDLSRAKSLKNSVRGSGCLTSSKTFLSLNVPGTDHQMCQIGGHPAIILATFCYLSRLAIGKVSAASQARLLVLIG